MEKDITSLVRPNILSLKPYSSARSEFKGRAEVFLDANENPFDTGLNRYPDPLQGQLKQKIAEWRNIATSKIFLGNGSDEAIDLLVRVFCEPGKDHIILLPPTYGMYQVCADIAGVATRQVALTPAFQPDVDAILGIANEHSKLLFLCSPNNPSANLFEPERMEALLQGFPGIVVVDEAYIDFASWAGCLSWLERYPQLVVLQTFSKAWGLAGIRLGMAFAGEPIIDLLNKVKPPYNINQLSQEAALRALDNKNQFNAWVQTLLGQRTLLAQYLAGLSFVERVYASQANFLLVKMKDPQAVYQHLRTQGIIVRDRSMVLLCEGCLRITVGTPEENQLLVGALLAFND